MTSQPLSNVLGIDRRRWRGAKCLATYLSGDVAGAAAGVAILLIVLTLAISPLAAQTRTGVPPAGTADAAATMTADEMRRHLGVLAQDSMRGRTTPSPELERTAQYVADQFQLLGLEPLGDGGRWFQRYAVPRRAAVDYRLSHVWFRGTPKKGAEPVIDEHGDGVINYRAFGFPDSAVFATDTVLDSRAPGAQGSGQARWVTGDLIGPGPIVLAGPHTVESVRQANMHDKVVVYIPSSTADTTLQQRVIDLLRTANHVIVVADEDSVAFAARRRAAMAHPPIFLDGYLPEAQHIHHWVVRVWAPAIESGLASAGLSLMDARALRTPIVRELNAVTLLGSMRADTTTGPTAPNTLGLLRGSEPNEVAVVTAPMDRDDASGVAGLLALAKAFTRAGTPPRRSIVFAAVSGGAKEFWGSNALISESFPGKIVLGLSLDRLGLGSRDSVAVNGLQDVELPLRPAWLAAQCAELGLGVVDGGTVVAPESDHFAFVRGAVPSLYVHGVGGAEAEPSVARPDSEVEPESRMLRFIFALTQELVGADRLPRWTAAGRERRSRVFGN